MKTVFEITKEYLIENKYDGLCGNDFGCDGCGIDDLMGCELDGFQRCSPAYKHECVICEVKECEYRKETGASECFKTEKQEKEKQP